MKLSCLQKSVKLGALIIRSLQAALTVAAEQQPCGVQVVEGVGLVTSSFQFPLGLASVFAEEVGGFFFRSSWWRWPNI